MILYAHRKWKYQQRQFNKNLKRDQSELTYTCDLKMMSNHDAQIQWIESARSVCQFNVIFSPISSKNFLLGHCKGSFWMQEVFTLHLNTILYIIAWIKIKNLLLIYWRTQLIISWNVCLTFDYFWSQLNTIGCNNCIS